MNYDIIIIGSGLGGLTAGAKLSKEGKKVLVLEQHDRPGGCATTFKRKDFTMEVGLHEMDGLNDSDMKTKIFNDLGVFDKVDFLKVPEFYRFVKGNFEITMPHNPDEAIKILLNHFPDEEEGIKKYFEKLLDTRRQRIGSDHVEGNVGEWLDSIINSDDLKLVLLGNLGYFHDNPYTLSLSYYTTAQGSYFKGGGNFIKGGSQILSNYLSDYIKDKGGDILLNSMVTEILIEDDKVIGVKYANKNEIRAVYANTIISNAALPQVAEQLLPEKYGNKIKSQISEMPIGASLLTLYLGFKKPLKEIGSKFYSYFVYDESVNSPKDIFENNHSDYSTRSFTFVDYSQVNSALAPEGKSVGAVCAIDYPKDWNDLSKEEYKAKKEEVAQIIISKLDKLIPGLKEQIEYYEVGTSKTVGRYILTPESAVYGFAQTPDNFMKPAVKSIDGLYFASAWTKTGGGFSGAIFSGYMCAFGILRKR